LARLDLFLLLRNDRFHSGTVLTLKMHSQNSHVVGTCPSFATVRGRV
jgi:hypothetical protein